MQRSIGRRRFIQSASATGSFLAGYGVVDRSEAAAPVCPRREMPEKLVLRPTGSRFTFTA